MRAISSPSKGCKSQNKALGLSEGKRHIILSLWDSKKNTSMMRTCPCWSKARVFLGRVQSMSPRAFESAGIHHGRDLRVLFRTRTDLPIFLYKEKPSQETGRAFSRTLPLREGATDQHHWDLARNADSQALRVLGN